MTNPHDANVMQCSSCGALVGSMHRGQCPIPGRHRERGHRTVVAEDAEAGRPVESDEPAEPPVVPQDMPRGPAGRLRDAMRTTSKGGSQ